MDTPPSHTTNLFNDHVHIIKEYQADESITRALSSVYVAVGINSCMGSAKCRPSYRRVWRPMPGLPVHVSVFRRKLFLRFLPVNGRR
jgi:hypothetical protein